MPYLEKIRTRGWTALFYTLRLFTRLWLRPEWIEHSFPSPLGEKGIYIANHASWIDILLLALWIDSEFAATDAEDYTLALNQRYQYRWWSKLTEKLAPVMFYDPIGSESENNRALGHAIRQGKTVVVFPEGKPTVTGALGPVCEGIASVLSTLSAPIVTLYISGTEQTFFGASRPRQKRVRLAPKIRVHVFPAITLDLPESLKGRRRTEHIATKLYDMLSEAAYAHYDTNRTLFATFLDAIKTHGKGHILVEDLERKPLSYRKVLIGSFVLASAFKRKMRTKEQYVGMLLPNVSAALLTFLGLQALGKTPAMLNFTAGRTNILSACATSELRTVITSRRFVEAAELEEIVQAMEQAGLRILYLERLRKQIGSVQKISGLVKSLFAQRYYRFLTRKAGDALDADAPAVILFTSGSENTPKGVVLSHRNLLANIAQLHSRIDFGAADCFFNPLPMFHTSGLTGGVLLPLLSGMKIFMYPSPLHYQHIPEMVADTRATILFATDTFLNGYARYARPYDLHRLRYVFAGAEKLREETRKLWAERFGVRVFEGYGVTETAPVLAFNTPMFCKPGTVGRFAPGIRYRLEPIEGISEGGRLIVKGANVMAGYLLADLHNHILPPADGWHDTGDIVNVDEEGFVHILGRAKRFAKIAGEMVALSQIEQNLCELWPDAAHAVLTEPDARKGEHLVLITTQELAARETIIAYFRTVGLPELYVPKEVILTNELPLLGSGKVDYPTLALWLAKRNSPDNPTAA